uniref:PX domain-containing protein n=2 Tax=Strigamia maritima TaxID=126957 RepID=T1JK28_STRMM
MIKVFIPRYRTVDEPNKKAHTVYEIDVYVSGKLHKFDERYRAFLQLHKKVATLKKHLLNTPKFPPKQLTKLDTRDLEIRRKGLENYFQALLQLSPTPTPLLLFLGIPLPSVSNVTYEVDWRAEPISHQHVVIFKPEYFSAPLNSDDMPDIVVKGVLMGLYEVENENVIYHSNGCENEKLTDH